MENIIEVNGLGFSYKDDEGEPIRILNDISFNVKPGEFLAVLGHNGSGKSTLAKLLNGVLTAEDGIIEGSIKVCGNELNAALTDDDIYLIRRNIGMVHQNPDNQIVATTVEEDVAFGPENLGIPSGDIRRIVDESLKKVGMIEYAKHAPHRLSGGQKQRVAIAGIIAMKPKIIVFDESTAMLDPGGRDEVMQTIHKMRQDEGVTVILITHYMNEAAEADRIIVLNDGGLYMEGTPEHVFSDVEHLRSVALDVPQVTELSWLLRKSGVNIASLPIHTLEAADILSKILTEG